MNLQPAISTVQAWTPNSINAQPLGAQATGRETFSEKCSRVVSAIADAMQRVSVTTVSCSYGKDSSAVLALTLEAARQLKSAGKPATVRIITSDTLVENPSQSKLNVKMAERALEWARNEGLNVNQIWVTPAPINHYLVSMIGGRGIASVAGSDATCSVDLKIQPMERIRRDLAKTYKAENILTLIGTRFDESMTRGANMRARRESATQPVRQETGSLSMSPIAHWSEGDVWRLLNGSERHTGFRTLDFGPTIAHYELLGDSTCDMASINQTAKTAKSPCSGGRGGCFLCQKVSADHSLENMLDRFPAYEPLARLSKAIRAGHLVPENRSFLAKTADDQGRIRIFSNAYSPSWTAQLLRWVLSIDATEDDRAAQVSLERGRTVARRFPRLLEPSHLLLIAFQWSRYGVQKPGEFIRIYTESLQGKRWALPTDEELEALAAKSDKKLMGKTIGYLQSDLTDAEKPMYRDHWRDMIGTDSGCAPELMVGEDGERAMYRNSSGMMHDTMGTAETVMADLSELRDPDGSLNITYLDFLWWYSMDFASGRKSHNDEMNFLIREGIIKARNGYQSTLAEYQRYNLVLGDLRQHGQIDTLEAITRHPKFVTEGEKRAQSIIATDAAPAKASGINSEPVQQDLFAAG